MNFYFSFCFFIPSLFNRLIALALNNFPPLVWCTPNYHKNRIILMDKYLSCIACVQISANSFKRLIQKQQQKQKKKVHTIIPYVAVCVVDKKW